MTNVISILNAQTAPARWIADWEALGGQISVHLGPFGKGGATIPVILHLAPALAYDHPQRRRLDTLKAYLTGPGNDVRIIDYLARRDASRGR